MKKRYIEAQKAQTPHARLLDMLYGGHEYAAGIQGAFSPESVAWWRLYQEGGSLTAAGEADPTPEQMRTFILESVLPFLLDGADADAIKASAELDAEEKVEDKDKKQKDDKKKSGKK